MPAPLTPEQRTRFEDGTAPAAHLDMLSAVSFRTVAAASRLGVFAALADGEATAADLAARIDVDAAALGLLLDALASTGHLHRLPADDPAAEGPPSYALTDGSRRWLTGDGGFDTVVEFWSALLQAQWGDLEESVRTGKPAVDFYSWLEGEPRVREQFHRMLASIAGPVGDAAVAAVGPVEGSLLDVGGGHALYTVAFLRAHPALRATVLDLPGALAVARRRCEEAGVADRVELVEADLREPLPVADGEHQLALLFNVVHGFDDATSARILAGTHRALAPGGRIAVVEQLSGGPPADPLAAAFVALFSLNLFHTQGGHAPHEATLLGLLADAGFTDVEASPLRESAAEWLLLGRR